MHAHVGIPLAGYTNKPRARSPRCSTPGYPGLRLFRDLVHPSKSSIPSSMSSIPNNRSSSSSSPPCEAAPDPPGVGDQPRVKATFTGAAAVVAAAGVGAVDVGARGGREGTATACTAPPLVAAWVVVAALLTAAAEEAWGLGTRGGSSVIPNTFIRRSTPTAGASCTLAGVPELGSATLVASVGASTSMGDVLRMNDCIVAVTCGDVEACGAAAVADQPP